VLLGVSNAWVQEWIETRYLDVITDVLRELAGVKIDVRLTIDPELFGRHRAEQREVFGERAIGSGGRDGIAAAGRSGIPQAGSGIPQAGSGVSQEGSGISQEGSGISQEGSGVSQAGSGISQEGSGISQAGSGISQEGSGISQEGFAGAPAAARGSSVPARSSSATGASAGRGEARLADLVEGPSNRLAIAAARRIVADPGRLFNPFFVFGPSGVGKSHLVRAIHAELMASSRVREEGLVRHGRRGRFVSADRFAQHFAASAQDRTLRKFRDLYRGLDVLVIDDVQILATKRKSQDELLYTIEALVASGRQVVIGCDRSPRSLEDLSPGLVNRFLGGLVTRIDRPDFATRWKIARRHASLLATSREDLIPWGADARCGARRWRGAIVEGALELIAQRFKGSVQDLVGAVQVLDVHGRVLGRSPTVEEARQALAEILCEQNRRVDVDRVQQEVVVHFGWTKKELVSPSRRRAVTFARHVAMYLTTRYTRHSMREIGKFFGDRDPSTVRFAQKKIANLLRSPDDPLAGDVFAIIDRLEA
jgi:chromosomal replication initiator protein